MSKVRDVIQLEVGKDDAVRLARQAVAELGWRILNQSDDRIVAKEVSPKIVTLTWAAQVELWIEGSDTTSTIDLNGSIGGLGPIQKGHLQGQLGALRNQIQVAAEQMASSRAEPAARNETLSSEFERLASLRDSGVLSEDEFAAAKARLLGD